MANSGTAFRELLAKLSSEFERIVKINEDLGADNVRLLKQLRNNSKEVSPALRSMTLSSETFKDMIAARSSNATESENACPESEALVDQESAKFGFVLREVWTDLDLPFCNTLTQGGALPMQESVPVNANVEVSDGRMQRLISFPGSPWRIGWDMCGGLFILYDMIVIPLRAFDTGDGLWLTIANWITLVFWTVNMILSPFVGYVKDGVTVMTPRRVLCNYLKSWFIIDVLVLLPDWYFSLLSLASSEGGEAGNSMRMIRVIRLMRFARLLRLAKLKRILNGINDLINSEYVSLIVNMNVLIVTLLLINHFVACAWFSISNVSEGDKTWVRIYGYEEAGWSHQYLASYHWSLAQFTPSTMDISPENNTERVFAVGVVIFALVGFSYLVGSITGCLTQLRLMQEDVSKQFWHLRRYMKHHKVPMALSTRIQRFLEHALQEQKAKVSTDKVKIFNLLSEQLRSELQCAMSERHLKVHPLFDHLAECSMVTMHRLSSTAISRESFARGDTIFIAEEKATHLEFVVAGRLHYIRTDSLGNKYEEWVDKDEDWISEPACWTSSWIHVGLLASATESDLLRVDAGQFAGAICMNPHAQKVVTTYANRFVEWINSVDIDNLTDIAQGDDEELVGRVRNFIMEPVSPGRPNAFEARRKSVDMKKIEHGGGDAVNDFTRQAL
eukprot:TRINITY_DN49294_c0_g1_i1.p1 TRINITY_DN49294_c0_g1~~TRINITY_DN49294_c0_g1_i1.p1  ORF type:complete len:673 (+),score=97.17 TRINITY_DN49294_c0_g1_i1:185-2203(+)